MIKVAIKTAILATAFTLEANAFTAPNAFSKRSSSTTIYAESNDNPLETIAKPLFTAISSAALATSILFSNPLMPTPEVQAAANVSPIATSIDIEIKNIPTLTRKVIANRDTLTNYVIESAKSIKPILELLSESDTVTVVPPKDVKGAVNALLTSGDAQFNVNGESVDVRVESVPGVIVVRVINPNIPRLPFLKDGTAALQFVDGIVDVAPTELNKVAEEAKALENFLTWGARDEPLLKYGGSSLDRFLSNTIVYNDNAVSLGPLGDLTNGEVIVVGLSAGIAAAYGASYSFYVSEREADAKAATDKRAQVAAKKKAKAAADAAAKKKAKAEAEKKEEPVAAPKKKEVKQASVEEVVEKKEEVVEVKAEEKQVDDKKVEEKEAEVKEAVETEPPTTTTIASEESEETKGRKRDAIKSLFRRKKE